MFGVKYVDSNSNESVSAEIESDEVIEPNRIIENVTIRMDLPFDDIQYGVNSPFSYEKLDENTFSIMPDYDTNGAQITITGNLMNLFYWKNNNLCI